MTRKESSYSATYFNYGFHVLCVLTWNHESACTNFKFQWQTDFSIFELHHIVENLHFFQAILDCTEHLRTDIF